MQVKFGRNFICSDYAKYYFTRGISFKVEKKSKNNLQ